MSKFLYRVILRAARTQLRSGASLEDVFARWPQLSDADRERIREDLIREGAVTV